MIKTNNIHKSYGDLEVLKGVDLQINKGEIISIVGASGAGKSTLLHILGTLDKADEGNVEINEINVELLDDKKLSIFRNKNIGFVFQFHHLLPEFTALENICIPAFIKKTPQHEVEKRAMELLTTLGLEKRAHHKPSELSGGEQQRVALARSLAPNPPLLMLDEPLGALDRALRERLMLELRDILKRVGVTAISVTHDQTEAFALADRVAVMNAGQIEQVAAPQTLFARPATPFVAKFLGFQNLLDGVVTPDDRIKTAIGVLETGAGNGTPGTHVTVLIPPDAATLGADGAFSAQVTAISFRGKFYQLWVKSAGVPLMFEVSDVGRLHIGEIVRLSVDGERIVVL